MLVLDFIIIIWMLWISISYLLSYYHRVGPNMVAIIIMTETKYACNERNDKDQIRLQSRLARWLNMLAISLKGTQYAFNHQNFIFARFGQNSVTWLWDNFWYCRHMWSVFKDIAIICDPIRSWDCIHIELLSWPTLQSYFFQFVMKIVIIFGPLHQNYCNNMWSSPYLYFMRDFIIISVMRCCVHNLWSE